MIPWTTKSGFHASRYIYTQAVSILKAFLNSIHPLHSVSNSYVAQSVMMKGNTWPDVYGYSEHVLLPTIVKKMIRDE